MATEATALKEKGNQALQADKFDEAIQFYSEAITLDPTNHILYSNRSLAYNSKKEWQLSLEDAQQSIKLNPTWLKGYLRIAEALSGLGRLKEASLAYEECLKQSPESPPIIKAAHKANVTYINQFFTPLTRNKDVAVKYINRNKGRGVFAKRKFLKSEIVYFENPLVSMRNVEPEKDHIKACSYTMKSIIPMEEYKFPWTQVMEERKGLPTEFFPCPNCQSSGAPYSEQYIGETAREKAWNEYHELLCVGASGKEHPVAKLIDLAREAKRTNPLFILRMFAFIVQRIKDIQKSNPDKPKDQVIIEAKEPLSMFIANEEKGPLENETIATFNSIVPGYEDVITLTLYRTLNGAILRNAQALNPLSELLVAVNGMGPQSRSGAIKCYNKDFESQDDLLQDEWFQSLCFHGTGLFLIGNSTNHSCDPNVVSTSSTNNFTITMVALKDIAVGEELCISYIDHTKDYDTRQSILKEMYLFDCKCEKCVYRW